MTELAEAAERLPISELADLLRSIPADEMQAFRDALAELTENPRPSTGASALAELAERPSRVPGRQTFALMALAACDGILEGFDPLDVLRVYQNVLRLHGTPAASRTRLKDRIAALPRKELT